MNSIEMLSVNLKKLHHRQNYFSDSTMRPNYRNQLVEDGKTAAEIEKIAANHRAEMENLGLRAEECRANDPAIVRQGLTVQEALTEGFIDIDDL